MASPEMNEGRYGDEPTGRDVREDSIPARMEELEKAIGHLAEVVAMVPNYLDSILRDDRVSLMSDGEMKAAVEPEKPTESHLSQQLVKHRQQIERIRRQVQVAMDRVDL